MKKRNNEIDLKLIELEAQETPAELLTDIQAGEMERILREMITSTENPSTLREFFKTFIERVMVRRGKNEDGQEELFFSLCYRDDKFVNKTGLDHVRSGAGWLPDRSPIRTKTRNLDISIPISYMRRAA